MSPPAHSHASADDARGDPTRQRLLDAALATFAERGYDAARTRDVCARARANGAALNYHWGSKHDLWLAVCEECGRRFFDLARTRIDVSGSAGDVVESVVGTVFDVLAADPAPARILAWASLQSESMDFDAAARPFRPVVDLAVRLLQDAQARGEVAEGVDVQTVLVLLYDQILFTVVDRAGHRHHFGRDLRDADHARRVRAALVRSARLLLGLRDERRSRGAPR